MNYNASMLFSEIVDETLEKLSGPDIQPEDLQFNIWIDGLSFKFEKNIAEAKLTMGVREDIDDVDEGRDVAQPSSSEPEPSSNELFQPTTSSKQSLKVVSSHYKKRAVEFWRSSTKKKRRSLKSKVTCVLTDIS